MGQIKAKLGEANLGELSIKLKGVDDKWRAIRQEYDDRLAMLQSMLRNCEESMRIVKDEINYYRKDFYATVEEMNSNETYHHIQSATNDELDDFLCRRTDSATF